MKRLIAVFLLANMLPSCCFRQGTVDYWKQYDIAAIVRQAVPTGYDTNHQWDEVELLETDQFGRRLYRYSSRKAEIRLVCQKTDYPYVCYYEDYCYLVNSWEHREFLDNDILWLKTVNDWDQPLDESRLHSIDYTNLGSELPNYSYKEACAIIQTALGTDGTDEVVVLDVLEAYTTELETNKVVYVRTYGTDVDYHYDQNVIQSFLVLYQVEPNEKVVAWEQIPNGYDFRDDIIAFKDKYCR